MEVRFGSDVRVLQYRYDATDQFLLTEGSRTSIWETIVESIP